MKTISVITPIYNMEKYIAECIESVLAQTLEEIELICIDDGSTDRSYEIIKDYQQKYDFIKIITQKRCGAGIARNKAIMSAEGEYLAFLDADDFYPSDDVLEYLYDKAKENNVYMAGGNMCSLYDGKEIQYVDPDYPGEDSVVDYKDYNFPWMYWRFIYKTSMIREKNIFFPDYKRMQDPPFMLKALVESKKIWITKKNTLYQRVIDKKISYKSAEVMNNIIRAYIDMMKLAYEENLEQMQKRLLMQKFELLRNELWIHIFKGNTQAYELIMNMCQFIIDENFKVKFEESWEEAAINEGIQRLRSKAREYEVKAAQFNKVIIYGASVYGKLFYDYLIDKFSDKFEGVAVTDAKDNLTMRGCKVRCISDYEPEESTLVVIAAKKSSEEMKSIAKQLGFKHFLVVDEKFIDVDGYVINNELFAVK